MPSQPPPGDPFDGRLPASALGNDDLSIYLHVPYCRVRCGYCDFNTYTAAELGAQPGTAQDSYLEAAHAELRFAHGQVGRRRVTTVFVGGGTPTLLPSADLVGLLDTIRDHFDLDPDAEVTTEANPESVTQASLRELRDGGFNRISFGMQSAAPHVLAALDRAVERTNEAVSRAESIRRIKVLTIDFTEANDYLTPSLKVKRSLVLEDFAHEVEALYSEVQANA